MTPAVVVIVFNSELSKIRDVLCDALNWTKNQFPYIPDSDLFDLRLVYSELLINAVIHGNKHDSSKKVELKIEARKNEIFSAIRDEGNGFNYFQALDHGKNTGDILNEQGRGLQLARSLTEHLRFNRSGNTIEFCKKINAANRITNASA